MHMPAATVTPESLTANLAICGISLCFSMHNGCIGFILTIAASPFFMKSGFSSFVAPVAGSSFLTISVIWHATCAVWTWNTGVYPTVMTVGWFNTISCAVNSVATFGGWLTCPRTSPLAMSFFSMPLT